MNILAYILNFETKNLLILQLIETIKDKLSDLITQILLNFSSNRYVCNMLNLQKKFNDIIKDLITKFIYTIDASYKHSDFRRKKYYINKTAVPRTIYTIFG